MQLAVRSTGARPWRCVRNLLALLGAICGGGLIAGQALAAPIVLHVTLGQASATPVSGRLLVFAQAIGSNDKTPVHRVDMDQIDTHAVAIAVREVARLEPGATVDIDTDADAFPTAFSQLKPGRYAIQAVLDRDHSYNYTGRDAGDLVSGVLEANLPGDVAQPLTLAKVVPDTDPLEPQFNVPDALKALYPQASADIHPIAFTSPALSRFWGRPIVIRGWVVTPPDYAAHPGEHYPTVYFSQGFGGTLRSLHDTAVARWYDMRAGKAPPMFWVAVDQRSPTGTSEFVDSTNNGPWGQAMTAELIPDLERRYRMDAKASGRLLTGHSSGGWAALWLQVTYPKMFGGAWPTSPDPSDFHSFLGVDLYAQDANLYRKPDGARWPLAQQNGQMLVALEDFTRREVVVSPYGGQMASFEWAFSPRGPDGRPLPLFDRATGAVDPTVLAYWRDRYDLAERVRRHWPELKRDLDGKIHLTVGAADTFYLDQSAHRLEAAMRSVGARTDFRYLEGRGHFDVYPIGKDPWGLYKTMAWEMYAVARPGSKAPPPAPAAPTS